MAAAGSGDTASGAGYQCTGCGVVIVEDRYVFCMRCGRKREDVIEREKREKELAASVPSLPQMDRTAKLYHAKVGVALSHRTTKKRRRKPSRDPSSASTTATSTAAAGTPSKATRVTTHFQKAALMALEQKHATMLELMADQEVGQLPANLHQPPKDYLGDLTPITDLWQRKLQLAHMLPPTLRPESSEELLRQKREREEKDRQEASQAAFWGSTFSTIAAAATSRPGTADTAQTADTAETVDSTSAGHEANGGDAAHESVLSQKEEGAHELEESAPDTDAESRGKHDEDENTNKHEDEDEHVMKDDAGQDSEDDHTGLAVFWGTSSEAEVVGVDRSPSEGNHQSRPESAGVLFHVHDRGQGEGSERPATTRASTAASSYYSESSRGGTPLDSTGGSRRVRFHGDGRGGSANTESSEFDYGRGDLSTPTQDSADAQYKRVTALCREAHGKCKKVLQEHGYNPLANNIKMTGDILQKELEDLRAVEEAMYEGQRAYRAACDLLFHVRAAVAAERSIAAMRTAEAVMRSTQQFTQLKEAEEELLYFGEHGRHRQPSSSAGGKQRKLPTSLEELEQLKEEHARKQRRLQRKAVSAAAKESKLAEKEQSREAKVVFAANWGRSLLSDVTDALEIERRRLWYSAREHAAILIQKRMRSVLARARVARLRPLAYRVRDMQTGAILEVDDEDDDVNYEIPEQPRIDSAHRKSRYDLAPKADPDAALRELLGT